MDFSTYAYPAVADYSSGDGAFTYPNAFDESYLNEPYTPVPDSSIAAFFDSDSCFDRPLSSIETGVLAQRDRVLSSTTMTPYTTGKAIYAPLEPPPSPTFRPTPFGQLEPFPSFNTSLSPQSQHSRTPSLCDDVPHQLYSPSSPELSPRLPLKRNPTDEDAEIDTLPSAPARKRGRPRLSQHTSPASTSSSSKQPRLPHNQVERKYRENLNSELERLRRAIPTLPQNSAGGGAMGQPKPSKAMVLAGAIEYIKTIETERDAYRHECERLSALVR